MKDKEPLSFRLEPELHHRLEECSKRLRIKKYTLALLALEAAVEAVEKNDYRIALPIQFDVTHVVSEKPPKDSPVKYPPHREEIMMTEDKPPSSGPATAKDPFEAAIDEELADQAKEEKAKKRAGQKSKK